MDGLSVIPLRSIEDSQFDPISQQLTAVLRDELNNTARLVLPYEYRNDEGFTQFAEGLANAEWKPMFIAGRVRLVGREVNLFPLCVVYETVGRRFALNPYRNDRDELNRNPNENKKTSVPKETLSIDDERSPISSFFRSLLDFHAEALLLGFKSPLDSWVQKVGNLQTEANSTGFPRIAELLSKLQDECIRSQNDRSHPLYNARSILKSLIMLSRIAGT
jgi:hypothetical protein